MTSPGHAGSDQSDWSLPARTRRWAPQKASPVLLCLFGSKACESWHKLVFKASPTPIPTHGPYCRKLFASLQGATATPCSLRFPLPWPSESRWPLCALPRYTWTTAPTSKPTPASHWEGSCVQAATRCNDLAQEAPQALLNNNHNSETKTDTSASTSTGAGAGAGANAIGASL